jgi:two-component system, response regulator
MGIGPPVLEYRSMGSGAIVVVEARVREARALVEQLASIGLDERAVVVADGLEALEYVFATGRYTDRTGTEPHAVVIDIDSSVLNGAEVARRIRAADRTASTRVILLTSAPSASLTSTAAQVGARLLTMPPDLEELRRSLVSDPDGENEGGA